MHIRSTRLVPAILMVLFPTLLFVALAYIQAQSKEAESIYLVEEAELDELDRKATDQLMFGVLDQAHWEAGQRGLRQREEEATGRRQAALDLASRRKGYVLYAGIALFLVFVIVTIAMGRRDAERSP